MFNNRKKFAQVIFTAIAFLSLSGFSSSKLITEHNIGNKSEDLIHTGLKVSQSDSKTIQFQYHLTNNGNKILNITPNNFDFKIINKGKNAKIVFAKFSDNKNNQVLNPTETFYSNNITVDNLQPGNYDVTVSIRTSPIHTESFGIRDFNVEGKVQSEKSPNLDAAVLKKLNLDGSSTKKYSYNNLKQLLNPSDHFLVKEFYNLEKNLKQNDSLPIILVSKNTAYFVLNNEKPMVYSVTKRNGQWDIDNVDRKNF